MKKGTLYFFNGLSGAGKTTIGTIFYKYLRENKHNVAFLDSDELGNITGDGLSASIHDRKISSKRFFRLCQLLLNQGIDVVGCRIAMFDDIRQWNRDNIENYYEIYVNASMETLKKLNKKNLYSGEVKEVVGVDLPCDYPKHPDVEIHNDRQETPEAIVEKLIRKLDLA